MSELEERIQRLRSQFDGAIKYAPMIAQHPKWTDEQCLEFAQKWDVIAEQQFRERGPNGWNLGIPYCRNDHTKANFDA